MATSRSGAVFIALSDWILAQGGTVYGAGYADHFRVVHKRAATPKERDEFKGSKYVQSDPGNVFAQVRADLEQGRHVLFSGTPCQTAGLRSVLDLQHAPTEKLWLVDLVCHGVPAPYVWRDYLAYVEHRQGEQALAVDFRDKSRLGWSAHEESFLFPKGKAIRRTYTDLFNKDIMFRLSCGVCPFACQQRPSDLTIGDFWGWEKVDAGFNADNRGVSLLLINTEKANGSSAGSGPKRIIFRQPWNRPCSRTCSTRHPSIRCGISSKRISSGTVFHTQAKNTATWPSAPKSAGCCKA